MNTIAPPSHVERVTQQSLIPELGEAEALDMCTPTCLYMLVEATGYHPDTLVEFVKSMDKEHNHTQKGWMRAWLAKTLRAQGVSVVSWRPGLNGDSDETVRRMIDAGFLGSQLEVDFYLKNVAGKSVEEVVRAGWPVATGMVPGFGEAGSKHTVIIAEWTDDSVRVIDPDSRNNQSTYSPHEINDAINPEGGGCTIILPPTVEKSA